MSRDAYADFDEYQSNWDWCVERSNYHFDYTKQDQPGEWFQPLGRFEGDWKSELDVLLNQSAHKQITWANRKDYRDKIYAADQITQEEYDLVSTGAPKDLHLTDRYDYLEDFPVLQKMSQYFGLEGIEGEQFRTVIHIQKPGQMFNLHIDKFWEKIEEGEDPSKIARIMVMLDDWKPGQFYITGTYNYTHWRAGDCFQFDWPNVPHATANASRWPRPLMMITGRKSDLTERIFKNSNAKVTYKL